MFTLTEMDKHKWLHLEDTPTQECRKSDSNNNDDSLTGDGNGMSVDDGVTSQKRLRDDDSASDVGLSETRNATTKRLRQTVIARRSSRIAAKLDDVSTSPSNHHASNSLLGNERDENGDVEKVYKCKVRILTCIQCCYY